MKDRRSLTKPSDMPAPALKEIFNKERIHHIAEEVSALYPAFNARRFISGFLKGYEQLSLMQRLRRVTETLHATLPEQYTASLSILYKLAPRLNSSFVTLVLPDYVALYGMDNFVASLDALKFFTTFGSSEFAIRYFLRQDLHRTLQVMAAWSRDENEHVRRLASEGCRPRLPWSFRIEPLMRDPSPVSEILENLKADPSLYVRKSVANHLNDITKDNPVWALDRIESWPIDDPRTIWIAKHALRSLIKKGDKRALAIVGAGNVPDVKISDLKIEPPTIELGDKITLSFRLTSTSSASQRLVADYAVHYVKKSGSTTSKIFKLKTFTLAAGSSASLVLDQTIRNYTTRVHYAGRHVVDILVNGDLLASSFFDLLS